MPVVHWHSATGGRCGGCAWSLNLMIYQESGKSVLRTGTYTESGKDIWGFVEGIDLFDGDYHHVMLSFDGTTMIAYADFEEVDTKTGWSDARPQKVEMSGPEGFCVGSHSFANAQHFKGYMRGLKIWGPGFTAAELKPTTVTQTSTTTTTTQTETTTSTLMLFVDVASKMDISIAMLLLTTALVTLF